MAARQLVHHEHQAPAYPNNRGDLRSVRAPGTPARLPSGETNLTTEEFVPPVTPGGGSFNRRRVVTKTTTERVVVEDSQNAPGKTASWRDPLLSRVLRRFTIVFASLLTGVFAVALVMATLRGDTVAMFLLFIGTCATGWWALETKGYRSG